MSGPLDAFGNAATEVAKAVTGAENRNALQEAAKGTPAMDLAGLLYARNLGIRQQAVFALYQPLRWFRLVPDKYFEEQFWDDLAAKLHDVPEDLRQTPKLSIAGPAMEGLAYSLDEPDLKDMYLNLLVAASNRETASRVHPSFVEILRQLSAEEGLALDEVLREGRIEAAKPGILLAPYHFGFHYAITRQDRAAFSCILRPGRSGVFSSPQVPVWLANWERLGLVELVLDQELVPFTLIGCPGWVLAHPQAQRAERFVAQAAPDSNEVALGIERGYIRSTPLGDSFFQSVCQADDSSSLVYEDAYRDPELGDGVTRVRASLAGPLDYPDLAWQPSSDNQT
jgi:hypothetical protein